MNTLHREDSPLLGGDGLERELGKPRAEWTVDDLIDLVGSRDICPAGDGQVYLKLRSGRTLAGMDAASLTVGDEK